MYLEVVSETVKKAVMERRKTLVGPNLGTEDFNRSYKKYRRLTKQLSGSGSDDIQ